ncbi:hypothetical protein BJF93_05625 [Xaviernesmea oryzae]|uniref:Uncharacterized protein n=1 Tax=Xaviernesmea oryzae TaxID=464029 RepID=A0A1Q9ARV1_9HYPH|nr:hypothetical protein BJF93_05625 [Xaviernesmea oryzae]SEL82516.1 hypothetical protein SAMN04487976_11379 [Xaviernesmea oryzae]
MTHAMDDHHDINPIIAGLVHSETMPFHDDARRGADLGASRTHGWMQAGELELGQQLTQQLVSGGLVDSGD